MREPALLELVEDPLARVDDCRNRRAIITRDDSACCEGDVRRYVYTKAAQKTERRASHAFITATILSGWALHVGCHVASAQTWAIELTPLAEESLCRVRDVGRIGIKA